jgi:hypothetical protein
MPDLIRKIFHRASMCPFACSLKLLLLSFCIFSLHLATSHRVDVGPYLFTLLVGLIGVIASLALAFHWNCQLRNDAKND